MCVNREMENMSDERTYNIKITGSGTFKEISQALLAVAEEMEFNREATGEPLFDIHWEDPILYTEVTEE